MKWFVNYQESQSIGVADRGFAYGDGIFETLLGANKQIQAEDLHCQRIARAARRLGLSFNQSDIEQLFCFIKERLDNEQGVKVIISRGESERGYLPPQDTPLTIAVGFFPYSIHTSIQQTGVKIDISPIPSTMNPFLAGLKHLNRLENVLAKQHLGNNCYEALMFDSDGFLVECIQSNIFWFKGGILFTPLLNKSGVQGTLRSQIIQTKNLSSICVGRYQLEDLIEADEIFICNRLIGVVPVIEINGKQTYSIGKHTQNLQQQLSSKWY